MRARVLSGLVLFICCASGGGHARGEDHALGTPDEQAIAKATALIRKTFSEEYAAARTPQQRAALATRLLREAASSASSAKN